MTAAREGGGNGGEGEEEERDSNEFLHMSKPLPGT
jgi:hypothetical protein